MAREAYNMSTHKIRRLSNIHLTWAYQHYPYIESTDSLMIHNEKVTNILTSLNNLSTVINCNSSM